jgi:hypothetical protein
MSRRKMYTRDFILKEIQRFVRENGRPPRSTESTIRNVASAAKSEFGSWSYALAIAGVQTYQSWHRKDTVIGRIKYLLNNHPMTLQQLRIEFNKIQTPQLGCSQTNISLKLMMAIRHCSDICSSGEPRSKIYFLKGQEEIAQKKLNQAPYGEEMQEAIFSALVNPLTKSQLLQRFPNKSSTERLLKELYYANLVGKARFVTQSSCAKYRVDELFGPLACKIYYFRLDSLEPLADLVVMNLPVNNGYAAMQYLRKILPKDAFNILERKMTYFDIRRRVNNGKQNFEPFTL